MKYIIILIYFFNFLLCCDDTAILQSQNTICSFDNTNKVKTCSVVMTGAFAFTFIGQELCSTITFEGKTVGDLFIKLDKIQYIPFCKKIYSTCVYNISTGQLTYERILDKTHGDSSTSFISDPDISGKNGVLRVCETECRTLDNQKISTSCFGRLRKNFEENNYNLDENYIKFVGDRNCILGHRFQDGELGKQKYYYYSFSANCNPNQIYNVIECENNGNYNVFIKLKYIDRDASNSSNGFNIASNYRDFSFTFTGQNFGRKNTNVYGLNITQIGFTPLPLIFSSFQKFIFPSLKKGGTFTNNNFFADNVNQLNNFEKNKIGDIQTNNENNFFLTNDLEENIQLSNLFYQNSKNVRLSKEVFVKQFNEFLNPPFTFLTLESSMSVFLNSNTKKQLIPNIKSVREQNWLIFIDENQNIYTEYSSSISLFVYYQTPKDFSFTINTNEVCPFIISGENLIGTYDSRSGSNIDIKIKSTCLNGLVNVDIDETKGAQIKTILSQNKLQIQTTILEYKINFRIALLNVSEITMKFRFSSATHTTFFNKTFKPLPPKEGDYYNPATDSEIFSTVFTDTRTFPPPEPFCDFLCSIGNFFKDVGKFFSDLWESVKKFLSSETWYDILIKIIIATAIVIVVILIVYLIVQGNKQPITLTTLQPIINPQQEVNKPLINTPQINPTIVI